MGFFSTKKKTYVASTVYNMVGDSETNSTYMQEAITSAILSTNSDPNVGLGESILNSHIQGPRGRQQSFFRWAKANYDDGMPRASIAHTQDIDHVLVANEIKLALGVSSVEALDVPNAFISHADESYYAEQYLLEHRPDLFNTEWAADYDHITNQITIQNIDNTTLSFTPVDFNSSHDVLVAYYYYADKLNLYIYAIGAGNSTLDSLVVITSPEVSAREFYPIIPLRIDNENPFSEESPARGQEDQIAKCFNKALGSDIYDLIDEIEGNEDIKDIDYAYMVFGVTLNTKSQFGKRYLWQFMRNMAKRQVIDNSVYEAYEIANDANGYHTRTVADDPGITITNSSGFFESALERLNVGSPHRAIEAQAPQLSSISIALPNNEFGNLDMKITWADIKENRVTGVATPGAKIGEVSLSLGDGYREEIERSGGGLLGALRLEQTIRKVVLRKQINRLEYIELVVTGMQHTNLIYKGKSVDIRADEALEDPDDSGFIIPLHEPTMRDLGLVNATEVSQDCFYIVFNSYKVVKKKWYQRTIFKVFVIVAIVVAIVVITVITAGSGTAPATAVSSGILGSSAAIGATLGFSGLLALAVGTAVNVVAGMIVAQIVTSVATKVLGDKIGQIVATVANIAISMGSGPGGFSFSNIGTNIASIGHIDRLIALTSSTANIYNTVNQAKLEEIAKDTIELEEEYNEETERLKAQFEALGFGDRVIDPTMLVDFSGPEYQMGPSFNLPIGFSESPDAFMSRTLATGSELADLSLGVVNDFVDASLTLS